MQKIKLVLLVCLVWLLAGCAIEDAPEQKSQVDFTLVAAEDIPAQLFEQIEEAKAQEMKIVFYDGEFLYLVRGYGAQPGGSNIQILELYRTEDGLVLDTELTGVDESQTTSAYPYLVVKVQSDEQNVVFQ